MDKRFISIAALCFTLTLHAQQIDLADAALKGIELEYLGNVVQNKKVELYSDITYWNRLGVRFRGWRHRWTDNTLARWECVLVVSR